MAVKFWQSFWGFAIENETLGTEGNIYKTTFTRATLCCSILDGIDVFKEMSNDFNNSTLTIFVSISFEFSIQLAEINALELFEVKAAGGPFPTSLNLRLVFHIPS